VLNRVSRIRWPRLVRQLGRLLHSWWRGDRIRVSPEEGRLLRLRPPCWLLIDGATVEVVGRTVPDAGRRVLYSCRTHSGVGTLAVSLDDKVNLHWHDGAHTRPIMASDIEVYSG